MKRQIVFAIVSVMFMTGLLVFVSPAPAYACSCAGPQPVAQELERKSAVFTGTVKQISKPSAGFTRSSADPVKITFEVNQVWKGEISSEATVYTALSGASCGYEGFAVQQTFIVFAHDDQGKLRTTLCDRTKLLSGASEELAALGEGYAPAPFEAGGGAGWARQCFVAGFGLAFVVIAAVIALAIWKRRRI
ncbi:MAG: hypothetical protein K0Q59_3635 [Paenibacillus sp.]|jgi:hypothetical protein|nr:hypothetical protein [Paenibacillus sp.]